MGRVFRFAGGSLPLGEKTYLMGILNVTPDSFYDGGRYFDPAAAVKKACALVEDGAHVIDIGAVSTRPNAQRADEAEEFRRLSSVLPRVRREVSVPISVDTFHPSVARWALSLGADIVNDVSGVFSPEMAAVVKDAGAGWIVMHAGGPAAKTETVEAYPLGVVNHVQLFFDDMRARAVSAGVPAENLCFDPGFGFAKTNDQNLELLRGFSMLKPDGALLCALSRKRFIRAMAQNETDDNVLSATLAADLYAAAAGADLLRVHDVSAHRALLSAYDRIVR